MLLYFEYSSSSNAKITAVADKPAIYTPPSPLSNLSFYKNTTPSYILLKKFLPGDSSFLEKGKKKKKKTTYLHAFLVIFPCSWSTLFSPQLEVENLLCFVYWKMSFISPLLEEWFCWISNYWCRVPPSLTPFFRLFLPSLSLPAQPTYFYITHTHFPVTLSKNMLGIILSI